MHSVSSPIVATTVVLLAVFIPVSFMGSITGLLFQQFSISIAVSVCISSFNALTLSPALCALLLKPRPKVQKGFFAAFNRWFGKRTEEYTSATTRFIGHLKRTGGIVAVTLAAIAVIWHFLPSGFLPDEDQGYVMVFVQTPEASSLQTTVKAMQRVDELVRQRPDVEATSFAAGFNMLAGIASSNSGIIFVKLVDYSQRSKTSSQIASALTEELYVAVPEAVSYAFISPSIPGLGVTSGITLQVQDLEGRGTEFLADETMRFMDSLRKQPQIGSVTTQFNAGIPQRRIEVDKEKALAQGVPLRSFYKTMSTLLGGSYINNFNRFGKLYQTYIQAAPEYRRDKYSLESYFVDDGQGNSIPVSSFTTVRDTTGVEFVSQFNLYRSIELTVNPAAKVSTGQAMDAIEAVAADVLPEAVGTTWSGLSYQEKTASGSSGAVYLLAIVFVFLTLSALYNSWGLPLAILLSVPLAVLGALLFVGAAYLVSPEFINNIYMQISLVMLIGLSAKNAILVVEYADQLFFEKNMDLKAATIEAARLRMRPIMMTAFSFILGVLPLVFASGVYATARNIMGVALIGGMLFATLLGIFLYPALYYLVGRVGGFERRRERQKTNVQP
jgi:HAE1 family hydrophobic/amphiphilic exporter-1